jgi:GNAT superfamily N-acetyltransferase
VTCSFDRAVPADAPAIAALRNAVAEDLTARYGHGHWSSKVTERGVVRSLERSLILVARCDEGIVGVLTLGARKPWAIDPAYFHAVSRPLYLTDMAVQPGVQRRGLGRRLVARAIAAAREWPAGAIRLDAYDAPAGAGDFYARCGFTEVGRVTYRGTPLVYFERLL